MNFVDFLFDYGAAAIWPLTFLVVVLYVFNRLRDDLQPILTALVNGLALQAGKNSFHMFIACLFGLSSSLAAFYDVFQTVDDVSIKGMSWLQMTALWTKVANPFIGGFLAYLIGKGILDLKPTEPAPSSTKPPFPPSI